jgi:hypothetical protein
MTTQPDDDDALQEDRWEPELSNPDDRLQESAAVDAAALLFAAGSVYYQRRSDLRAAEDFRLQHGHPADVDEPIHFGSKSSEDGFQFGPELPDDGFHFGPELPDDGFHFGPEPPDASIDLNWTWPER